jgi:hypothetical protein
VVQAVRARHPDTRFVFRADNSFGVPQMYDVCEELRIDYVIGIKMNPVLTRRSEALVEELRARQARTGQPQRGAVAFEYQAGRWPHGRLCIVRVEVVEGNVNRRAIITNRRGAEHAPLAGYDDYSDRGESENRNKELKRGLWGDRLSDHRFMANLFRLHLHVTAHNLLVRLRRLVADPPPEEPDAPLPREALPAPNRRRYFNERQKRDPLGEGHPCTWRTRLIKVAAEVITSTRRILVRLTGHWPYLDVYRKVAAAVQAMSPPVRLQPG